MIQNEKIVRQHSAATFPGIALFPFLTTMTFMAIIEKIAENELATITTISHPPFSIKKINEEFEAAHTQVVRLLRH